MGGSQASHTEMAVPQAAAWLVIIGVAMDHHNLAAAPSTIEDVRDDFGADGFCQHCRICTQACPPQAIADEKQMVRGHVKWYVDFDRCIPYFGETFACGICIAVCPWSRPGVAPRLAEKLVRRRERNAAPAQPPEGKGPKTV